MTSRRRFIVTSLAGLALAPGLACKQSDTVLVIYVAGPRDVVATQLHVTVTAGTIDTRAFLIPQNPVPGDVIAWPCSFTLSLDRSHTGPITVSVDAWDSPGSTVGFGTTTMEHIQIGGQTDITVMLDEGLPPDMVDAGTRSDGSAGRDGAAGTGGAAGGQGGAAGQDAAAPDARDDSGLDGATD